MKNLVSRGLLRKRLRVASGRMRSASETGAALLETVMSGGFLVGIAIVMNKMLQPVVVQAFEKIAAALASVGP